MAREVIGCRADCQCYGNARKDCFKSAVPLPVSVADFRHGQCVFFDVCFHNFDSMNLLCERLPRFLSIFAHVSTCIVIDLWMRFRAFFTPGFLPAPMRLPPRCLVWFILVKLARYSRAPVV